MTEVTSSVFDFTRPSTWSRGGAALRSLLPQLAALALAVGLARMDLPNELGRLASVVALFLLLWVPGGLLVSALAPGRLSWLEASSLRLVAGVTFYMVVAYPLLLIEAPFIALDIAYAVLALVLLVVVLRAADNGSPPVFDPGQLKDRRYRWLLAAAVILGVLVFVLLIEGQRTPDIWPHATSVNRYLEAGALERIGSPREDLNGWPASWSYLARLIGADAPTLYTAYMPLLLGGVGILAWLALARSLFGRTSLVLVGAVVQLLVVISSLSQDHTRSFFELAGEDKGFVVGPLFFVAQALALRFTRGLDTRVLVALVTVIATAALMHPAMGALVALSVAVTIAVLAAGRLRQIRIGAPTLIFLAGATVAGLAVCIAGFLYLHEQLGQVFEPGVIRLPDRLHFVSGDWYIASPNLLLDPLVLLNLAATVVFLARWRHDRAARYLAAQNLFILLLAFNPLTTRALGTLITPAMVWRLVWLLPTALGITYLIRLAAARLRLERRGRPGLTLFGRARAPRIALACLPLLALTVMVSDSTNAWQRWDDRDDTLPDLRGVEPLTRALDEDLPDGTLVAAPPKIGPYLGAYTQEVRSLYRGRPRLGSDNPAGERLHERTVLLYYGLAIDLGEVFRYSEAYEVEEFVLPAAMASCWLPDDDLPLYVRLTRNSDGFLFQGGAASVRASFTDAPTPPIITAGSDSGASESDGVTRNRRPVFEGRATPGLRVQVLLDDEPLGVAEVGCDGGYRLIEMPRFIVDGEYSVAARALGFGDGASGALSESTSIEIDTVPPSPPNVPRLLDNDDCFSERSPNRSGDRPTFAGSAEPGAVVTVYDGRDELGQVSADSQGNWTYESQGLAVDVHHINARATDAAGNPSKLSEPLRISVGRVCASD